MPSLDFQVALNLVRDTAKEMGVDPDVAVKIAGIENRGQKQVSTDTTSSANARGIMQVIPSTLQSLQDKGFLQPGLDYQNDPKLQIRAGVAALKELNSRGITDPTEMAIGYNASPAVLESYRAGRAIPAETAEYIRLFNGGKMPTSTSTRTSTTTRTLPSGVESDLFDSIDKASDMSANMQSQLAELSKSYTGTNQSQQAAVAQAGFAGSESAKASGEIEAGKVDNAYSILTQYGINPDDSESNGVALESAQAIDQIQKQRLGLQNQISNLKSTPITNPLDWIVNNFKAIPLVQQHNALATEENNAITNIRTRQQLATAQSAIQPAAVQDEIRNKAIAEATLAKATADAKVAGLQGDAFQMQARTLIETMNAQRQDSQQQIQVAKLFMDKIAQSQGITYANAQEKKEQEYLAPINMKLRGLVPGFVDFNPLTWKAQPQEMKDRLTNMSVGGGGATFEESMSTMQKLLGPTGMQKIIQKNAPLGVLMTNAVKGGEDALKIAEIPVPGQPVPFELRAAKNEQDRMQYGIKLWKDAMLDKLKLNDNTKLSADNPYKFKPGIVVNIPGLANNPFTTYLKSQGAGQGNKIDLEIEDKQLFTQALARVRNGDNVDQVANQLEEFYIKGYKAQTEGQSTTAMGLPYKPTYPLQLGLTTFSPRPVQALNAVSIKRWLVEQSAAAQARNAISEGLGTTMYTGGTP